MKKLIFLFFLPIACGCVKENRYFYPLSNKPKDYYLIPEGETIQNITPKKKEYDRLSNEISLSSLPSPRKIKNDIQYAIRIEGEKYQSPYAPEKGGFISKLPPNTIVYCPFTHHPLLLPPETEKPSSN